MTDLSTDENFYVFPYQIQFSLYFETQCSGGNKNSCLPPQGTREDINRPTCSKQSASSGGIHMYDQMSHFALLTV